MKLNLSPAKILTFAFCCLMIGVFVAYYNTSSFGYDNANIISFNNEEIWLMNFRIEYKDIKTIIEAIKALIKGIAPKYYINV